MIDKTTPQPPPVDDNTQTTTKQKHAPLSLQAKIWRFIKLYTRILIYVPLILLMLIAVLIGTPFGSKVTVVLVNQFVSDISAHYQSGTLNSDLTLDHLSWTMPGISVDAQDVELNWIPTCLINSQVCVSNLSASKLKVDIVTDDIPHSTPSHGEAIEPEQTSHQELLLPITISLNKAQFKQVDVTVNKMIFHADELATEAIWNESGLQIDHLSSLGLMVNIPTTPTSTQQNLADDLNENDWPLANLPQIYMPFPLKVKQLEATQSELIIGERVDHFSLIRLGANFRAFQLGISQLDIAHDYGDVTVIGDIAFEQNYPLTLKLQANIKEVDELPGLTNHSLRLELTQDLSQLNINAIAKGDNRFNLAATVDLTSAQLAYQLELSDTYIQWPMLQPQYITQIKHLSSQGDLHDQIAKLQGQLTTPYHPNLDIVADIDNRNKTLKVNQLSVKSIAGNIDLDGQLSYKNDLNWQVNVITNDIQLQHIDYLSQYSPMTSLFSGHFTHQGMVNKNNWQVAIEQADLSGRLNGYPLNLQGNITLNQALAINADNLQAHALGAHLIVNGTADTIWDIDAELNVPDLRQWLKGGRGSIYAKVDVSGNSANPIVDVDAQINKLSYHGSKIDNVSLVANYQPYEQHRYSIDIKNSLLFWNNYKLSELTLRSEGDQHQQQTTLSTLGDIVINSQLASTSDLDKQRFEGVLTQFNIANALGIWQQNTPITINWDQSKQIGKLSGFCLVHPHNRLCLVNDINLGHTGQANINFSGNPGQLFAPILSKKITWDGQAALTSEIHWAKGKKPTADLQFTLMPGNITLTRAKTKPVSIDYQQLLLHASLDEKQVNSSLSFNSSGIANWQSQLSVNITPDRTLQGNIDINALNLAPFGEFFPRLATLEGLLSSRLTLNGSLMEPRVSGNIKLNDGAFALSSNPTLIDKLYLSLALEGQQGQLSGQWHMGDGEVSTQGTLAWPQGQFSGDINIKGSNLAVIQPPMAILSVSPDINMTFDQKLFAVKGQINVPSGQIKIVPLAEGGIAVSNDVVFNDSISEQTVKTSPYAITADVNVNVGKNLTVDGMGLKGKLSGNLLLQQQAFKPPMLFGDVKINNGSYKFMGQTLTIDTGEVQFVGPISVPNLNIEATRDIKDEDITAGVRVTGTPMRPVVTLFSSPVKEQAEVLSYILTGKGFTSTSNEQSNSLMMGAALSLGAQFDGGAMNSIGSTATGLIEKFGFSNVQLDTNDDGKVAVSGYIGEDLMIKYGVGVFNPGYEMTVRYYLLSQLYLESVSSTLSQSLDIYYSFEID
ncbi:MAG: translocation/assembly module TamB domain-containing protein [Shewanella sp.]|uniref:autotransporter assembly complex protein TamB n=1 Tax=Shewanella sp. TaxID=50422 RepID=UPI003C768C9A